MGARLMMMALSNAEDSQSCIIDALENCVMADKAKTRMDEERKEIDCIIIVVGVIGVKRKSWG